MNLKFMSDLPKMEKLELGKLFIIPDSRNSYRLKIVFYYRRTNYPDLYHLNILIKGLFYLPFVRRLISRRRVSIHYSLQNYTGAMIVNYAQELRNTVLAENADKNRTIESGYFVVTLIKCK